MSGRVLEEAHANSLARGGQAEKGAFLPAWRGRTGDVVYRKKGRILDSPTLV
jgi:hypothetical protein